MQQYQVPQFITIEDKVIGPLTVKQALYIGVGIGIIVLAKINFEAYLFWPIAVVVGGFSLLLAFAKINEQPFPRVAKNALMYMIKPRLYVWQRMDKKKISASVKKVGEKSPSSLDTTGSVKQIPKLSNSRISDLAWSLDIKEMWKDQEER